MKVENLVQWAQRHRRVLLAAMCVTTLTLAVPAEALAVTRGAEFQEVYELIRDWTTGHLGMTIAMAFLLVGMGWGVMRGSVITVVSALAATLALVLGPGIIESIFSSSGASTN